VSNLGHCLKDLSGLDALSSNPRELRHLDSTKFLGDDALTHERLEGVKGANGGTLAFLLDLSPTLFLLGEEDCLQTVGL
jgi:hypothetical protein